MVAFVFWETAGVAWSNKRVSNRLLTAPIAMLKEHVPARVDDCCGDELVPNDDCIRVASGYAVQEFVRFKRIRFMQTPLIALSAPRKSKHNSLDDYGDEDLCFEMNPTLGTPVVNSSRSVDCKANLMSWFFISNSATKPSKATTRLRQYASLVSVVS